MTWPPSSDTSQILILTMAIPVPLYQTFDYLPPHNTTPDDLIIGTRFKISFGRTITVGLLINVEYKHPPKAYHLKQAICCLDTQAIIDTTEFSWLKWISQYYHYPLGETLFTALPNLLSQIKTTTPVDAYLVYWKITKMGENTPTSTLQRAPKQAQLLAALQSNSQGLEANQLKLISSNWSSTMARLSEKKLVTKITSHVTHQAKSKDNAPLVNTEDMLKLNPEQQHALTQIQAHQHTFHVFLLDGVTGSGKTEVYLQVIQSYIRQQQQVLFLIPEIGLTPQLYRRFSQRFNCHIAILHSGLTNTERLQAWQHAKDGEAKIIIGTRSAVFTSTKSLGIIIIDEEHDASFKQQEGLRYGARDIAIVRAQSRNIPIILGSATPAFESLLNVEQNRYTRLVLPNRAGQANPPNVSLLDLRSQKMETSLSHTLLEKITQHLDRHEQVLLFLNRRGFAPTLICHECGWLETCQRCDTHMTIHIKRQRMCCHHCGTEKILLKQCPRCSSLDLRGLGSGTERVEITLHQHFPNHEIIRVDRDSTRGKNSMRTLLEKIHQGSSQIILGTQMLAKGHDFPNITLVGILEADQGLFGCDFRATERMAQLITQVAGRAGRGKKMGQVIIQTHHPDHPLLNILLQQGYHHFAQTALSERDQAQLPPYTYAALFRAEATQREWPLKLLTDIKTVINQSMITESNSLSCLGPAPSPLEKRAGKFRLQLLLISTTRVTLHQCIEQCLPQINKLPAAKKVRWSLDIDPCDMY